MKIATDFHLEDFQEPGNIKPILEAIKYGLSNKKSEQFGFFKFNDTYSDYEFIKCENLTSFNPNLFSCDDYRFYTNYLDNKIIALFHTHIIDSPEPSPLDIELSSSIGLPSFIVSCKSKQSYLFYPNSYKPQPLSKRAFIPFFQDCVTFVKDFYYFNYGIHLSKFISNWARHSSDSNKQLISTINQFFYPVDFDDIREGDLIIFHPTAFPLFHLGVCCSDSKYWHHPAELYPSKELLSQLDSNKVYKLYRYKDL